MNKFIGIGRLAREPEVRYSQNDNLAVARYTIAIDRMGKDKGADFISCVAFGKAAEFVEKYLAKGTKVAIEGHIQTGQYKDKEGRTVYTTDVIVTNHEFCERKNTETSEAPNLQSSSDDFMSIPDGAMEELPFM